MAKKDFIFQIYRQDGFTLNPNDKIVNGVIKGIKRCNGQCPCYHAQEGEKPIPEEDLICPCKEYRENKHCRCNLYVVKEPENHINVDRYIATIEDLKEYNTLLRKSYEEQSKELKTAQQKLLQVKSGKNNEKLVY